MPDLKFPMDVVVQQTVEAAKADMDYYDDDALDEESIDPVGIEIGNSMESVEVESMEHLHEVMQEYGDDYVLSDNELAEHYSEWLEANVPSRFGIEAVDVGKDKPEMEISFFHDSADCLRGEEHDWSGFRHFWDRCEDPSHEGLSDEEHEKACLESPSDLCRAPSGSERYCVKCGMGAMHHSLMTAEE